MAESAAFNAFVNQLTNPPNPMDQVGKTIGGLNLLQQYRADQAAADAYRQSIDPQTGEFDINRFNAIASQAPGGSWKFGTQMQQSGQGLQAQGQGTQQQIQASLDQQSAIASYLQPLTLKAINNEPITGQEVSDLLRTIPPGLIPPTRLAQIQQQVDAIGPTGSANNFVLGAAYANQHAQEVTRSMLPGTAQLDTRTGAVIYQPNPRARGGMTTPYGNNPYGLSPGEATEIIPVQVGGGQVIQVPRAQAIGILQQNPELQKLNPGMMPQISSTGAPTTGAGATTPPSGGGAAQPQPAPSGKGAGATGPGRYPQPPAAAPAPTPAPTPPPAPTPTPPSTGEKPAWLQPPDRGPLPAEAGGVGTQPSPQYAPSVGELTGAASKNAAGLATQRAQTTDQIAILDDMDRVLNQPGVMTGVGAQQVSKLRQVAMNMGLVPSEPGQKIDLSTPEAAQAELVKDAALLTRAGLGAMGNPTDARQELITESTPGPGIGSKEGNKNVVRMLKGNAQAIQVMDKAWSQAQKTAQWTAGGSEQNNFNAWRDKFLATDPATGGRFDPTVFWLANHPNLAEQKKYIANLPDDAKQQLVKNLNYASKMGWIKKRDDTSAQVVSP